jgi:hypothetical protein
MKRIPEWLQIGLFILVAVVAVCLLNAAVNSKTETVKQTVPHFIIVSREQYPLFDGTGGYILEWAKDGEMQIPAAFQSLEEREIFERYLEMCGEVEK